MVDLFDNYEHDFQECTFSVVQRLQKLPNLSGVNKNQELDHAEVDLVDAAKLLQSMQMSVKGLTGPQKNNLKNRVANYELELQKLRKDFKKAKAALNSDDRRKLFAGSNYDDTNGSSYDQRARLLSDIETADATSEVLLDARRNANTAFELGVGIAQQLDEQRSVIQRARERLRSLNDTVAQANRIMTIMFRRARENKLIILGIILGLLGCIILVIWIKFFPSSNKPDNNSTTTHSVTSAVTQAVTSATSSSSGTSATAATTGAAVVAALLLP